MPDPLSESIARLIRDAHCILLISHIRPDGDAIGSLLGLGLALQTAGKDVQMVLSDGIPRSFRQLPGSGQVSRKVKKEYDISIVLDCSDLQRVNGSLGDRTPDLNIDHHVTNLNFARLNFVDPQAVATAAILAENLHEWGLAITEPVATALLTGLVSDTLGFRTSNVTPASLRLAALLMEHGANLSELYNRALINRSYEAARYWGFGLNHLEKQGRLVWATLTLEDRVEAGYPGNDDADLINVLSSIEESDVAIIFTEQKENRVKVSWRAQPGINISEIALQFGGGGHPAAAGAEIIGNLEDVQEKVLRATENLLENSAPDNGHLIIGNE
jgi:phosphoesterase RecJ-like protein